MGELEYLTDLHKEVAESLLATQAAHEYHDCSNSEKLFGMMVLAVETYVASVVSEARARPLGEAGSLGDAMVDAQILADPTALADFERALFNAHLVMTLTSLEENLERTDAT